MKSGNLSIVALKIREVEMVGKGFLGSRKPHGLELVFQLAPILILINIEKRKRAY